MGVFGNVERNELQIIIQISKVKPRVLLHAFHDFPRGRFLPGACQIIGLGEEIDGGIDRSRK